MQGVNEENACVPLRVKGDVLPHHGAAIRMADQEQQAGKASVDTQGIVYALSLSLSIVAIAKSQRVHFAFGTVRLKPVARFAAPRLGAPGGADCSRVKTRC